jgi:molybdenum cofactor biosynthesis enzyme MoaA
MIKGHRLKLLWVLIADTLGLRHLVVQFDPVNLCNLRCTMCYYGNPDYTKRKRKSAVRFSEEEVDQLAQIFFRSALALNIGCAAEPTVYKNVERIVALAKRHRVPTVSFTTNGQVLTDPQIRTFIDLGLDEIIVSCHGVDKETYEKFMVNAAYDKFVALLDRITKEKRRAQSSLPHLRINYTVNPQNLNELSDFFSRFGEYDITTLQIRPVVDIADAPYQWESFEPYQERYHQIIEQLEAQCVERNILLLATRSDPTLKKRAKKDNSKSFILDSVLRPIKPGQVWKKDFDWKNETYRQYRSRKKFRLNLLKVIFGTHGSVKKLVGDKPDIYLTYDVK